MASPGRAETEAEFFKGKQIRMVVGFPAGNEYDLGARLLARHYTRHLPGNPSIIVQNMPQAASIVAANFVYSQAPRDGTMIGAITRNIVNQALLGLQSCAWCQDQIDRRLSRYSRCIARY